MSNVASTAIGAATQQKNEGPRANPTGPAQAAFNAGTRNLLDEARALVENAAQQGQELNPSIYRMLGMEPTFEDHTAELQASQQEFDAAQKQLDEAQTTMAQLKGVPKGKRSPAQKKQYNQLKKQMPALQQALAKTRDVHGRLATSPKSITGFTKMDPNDIPEDSPFSARNPLHQAQNTEQQRLNQYLAGDQPVDPTLKHQYDQAEATLKQNLAARYGPDFANSTVGQMALQNFARQKNEAFATWNQQMVERYNQLAFGGAQNLQQLTAGQIALLREPEQNTVNAGNSLSNLAGARISQQTANLAERSAARGLVTNITQSNPLALAGGLGSLLSTPYQTTDANGQPTTSTLGGAAARGAAKGAGALYDWATGAGAGSAALDTAAGAAAADAAAGGGGAVALGF